MWEVESSGEYFIPDTSNFAFCRDSKMSSLLGKSGKRASSFSTYLLSFSVAFPILGSMLTQSRMMVPMKKGDSRT
jgi:hypothetical protein